MSASDPAIDPEIRGLRPLVARPANPRLPWLFGIVAAISAGALFAALEARRATLASPAISSQAASVDGVAIAPPPPLAIPADYVLAGARPVQAPQNALTQPVTAPAMPRQARGYALPPSYAPSLPPQPYLLPPVSPPPPSPAFAYQASPRPAAPPADGSKTGAGERVQAERFANPSTTVPQGSIVQVVLETALDSTRAGFARAIVSRDVSGFDGSRVLIPKGSKLFGEYAADVNHGQNRALIQWHRLMRPDGSLIDMNSPSADPLGRAGVKGKVNSHFFARFGGAILQSVLDIGVQVAARKASGDSIILFPTTQVTDGMIQRPADIKPTLKVRQGTSVSVFVARDLDFSAVEH